MVNLTLRMQLPNPIHCCYKCTLQSQSAERDCSRHELDFNSDQERYLIYRCNTVMIIVHWTLIEEHELHEHPQNKIFTNEKQTREISTASKETTLQFQQLRACHLRKE